MKKLLAILLSALLLMTLLAACGTTDEPAAYSPAPVSEAPESEAPVESAEPVELTIWHDNDENLMQAGRRRERPPRGHGRERDL